MRIDFNISIYLKLVEALLNGCFTFKENNSPKEINTDLGKLDTSMSIYIRQDVDRLPGNSLEVAKIHNSLGIRSVFYFRVVEESWDEKIITQIAELGHEVGYHYEDLSFVEAKLKAQGTRHKMKEGDYERRIVDIGIKSFKKNLERFRKIVPVSSICMHGSPLSKWDSRLLWKYFNYKDFGIEIEPYFDVNFEDRLYLTDTGRRWNGNKFSVRDKAQDTSFKPQGGDLFSNWVRKPIPGSLMNMTLKANDLQNRYIFRHTRDIIKAIEQGEFPRKVMMTFHPQRWTDKPLPWLKELVWQNTKNLGKYYLVKIQSKS